MTGKGEQNDPYIVSDWNDFITATGTSGAYVEFPQNLVKTSDTEVVEGKLYVDSTGEPVTNPVPSKLSEYYENTFVLDQNEYAPEGLTSILEIKCTSLNGRGGMIKNIHFLVDVFLRLLSSSTVRNVNFNNWLIDTNRYGYSIYGGKFYKCIFSASFSISGTFITGNDNSYGRPLVQKSSFYFTRTGDYDINVNTTYMNKDSTDNRFYFECAGTSGQIKIYKMNRCLVQGNVGTSTLDLAQESKYFVVDCIANRISGSSSSYCIANSDKCSSISGLIAVTTEQLNDAEYLSSIGFLVQTKAKTKAV